MHPPSGYRGPPLRRDMEQIRNHNPGNHVHANSYSTLNTSPSINPGIFMPSSTTTYYNVPYVPSYSTSWSIGISSTNLKVSAIALAILGAAFFTVGAVALIPELIVVGMASLITGGILIALDQC